MPEFGSILFVEDNPRDVELTLGTLTENLLLNRVVHVKDSVEAVRQIGRFWAMLDELPTYAGNHG